MRARRTRATPDGERSMKIQHQMAGARTAAGIARSAIAIALLGAAAGHAVGAEPPAADAGGSPAAISAAWQAAQDAYDKQHYAASLAMFERLAAQGDARAAARAGEMLLYAHRLYPKAVAHDLPRAVRWLEQAATGGSLPARWLLDRVKATPRGAAATDEAQDAPYVPGPHGC